jgi:lysophospholipase L1-like esterase
VALLAERLDQIIYGKPRAIFLQIGTNDLTHGPENRAISYQQYRNLVERIQKATPSTSIYVQSLMPRGAMFRTDIEDFNREIEQIAREQGLFYVNLYPHFLAEDGSMRNELSNDELHLMGQGYELWGELLAPLVEPYRKP